MERKISIRDGEKDKYQRWKEIYVSEMERKISIRDGKKDMYQRWKER